MTQDPWGLALGELDQAEQTGRDVDSFRTRLAELNPNDESHLLALYDQVLALPAPADWPYFEASDLPAITASLADVGEGSAPADIDDRMAGAWTGRVIGNMMGKPFEIGPTRASIRSYLEPLGRYPLAGYVPFADGADRAQLGMWGFEGVTESRIDGGTRDDDIDYTVLGLHLVETYGIDYTTRDVAVEWLSRFPAYQVFTAERNAYQNLIREVPLDDVGEYHNPFREWIGALIRADIFGFIYAGRSRAAALAAYYDARLSHRANGIYGEMWAAALVASAFTSPTPEASVEESLRHLPPASRLAEEIRTVVEAYRSGANWETALDALAARHPRMSWVHTINNAGALTAAILWGEGDFARTAGLAVTAGLDTDSIGATAGAWAGAFVGLEKIPAALADPLHDSYRSGVFGIGDVRLSDLATRTTALVRRFQP
ncbi:ADP-ribosylglycohydrolase family protein [Herbiconiux ginsengi]|nr:ADP-ribosylglycohydrolase family protein [Herbiconiux ginsengi]